MFQEVQLLDHISTLPSWDPDQQIVKIGLLTEILEEGNRS